MTPKQSPVVPDDGVNEEPTECQDTVLSSQTGNYVVPLEPANDGEEPQPNQSPEGTDQLAKYDKYY
jgi:hypothetical protein